MAVVAHSLPTLFEVTGKPRATRMTRPISPRRHVPLPQDDGSTVMMHAVRSASELTSEHDPRGSTQRIKEVSHARADDSPSDHHQ